jgi:glutathione reductase (NADPH)
MSRWAGTKATEIDRLEGIYRKMLDGSQVELIEGWARITGPNTVQVGERQITTRHLLVATGGSTVRDAIPGIETCATSDDLLDLQSLPDEVAIIGSGFIAVEFASMLARLGPKVSLYYRSDLPLRGFDTMLRTAAATALQAAGIELHPGVVPTRIQRTDDCYVLELGAERIRSFPWVLNATGRRPNTQGLGLETLGVEVDAAGAVPVNDDHDTPVAGVYAIGDVTNRVNLTPVAIAQGRGVADRLFGQGARQMNWNQLASAVFMMPPIGSVGPSEAQALAAGHRLKVFETDFRPMKQAFIGGTERAHLKLLVDADTDRVLAVHMLGADAPEIVQSLAVALTAGATKADFDNTVAVHPTAAEEFVLLREVSREVSPEAPL